MPTLDIPASDFERIRVGGDPPPSLWERIAGLVRNPKHGGYRQDLPELPDRLLVIAHDGVIIQCLDHIGPGFEDNNDVYLDLVGTKKLPEAASGLYLWEGIIHYIGWTNYEGVCDDVEVRWKGAWRRATLEEALYTSRGEYIWNHNDWYEPEYKPEHEPPPW